MSRRYTAQLVDLIVKLAHVNKQLQDGKDANGEMAMAKKDALEMTAK